MSSPKEEKGGSHFFKAMYEVASKGKGFKNIQICMTSFMDVLSRQSKISNFQNDPLGKGITEIREVKYETHFIFY